jgi:hypothetical protein
MKKTKHNKLWIVSYISAFLGEGIFYSRKDLVVWHTDKGEINLDTKKLEVGFVDSTLDLKTQFAIQGLAHSNGYTTEDYFTEKI